MANTPMQAAITAITRRRPPWARPWRDPAHDLQAAQQAQRPEGGGGGADGVVRLAP